MAFTDHNSKQFEGNIIRLQLRTTCTKLSLDTEPNKESEQRLIVAEQGGHVYLEQLEYLDEDEPVRDHYTIHHLPADAIHSVLAKVKHHLPMFLQTDEAQHTDRWYLTLTNDVGEQYLFRGRIGLDQNKELSDYLRTTLQLPNLWAFIKE
jgi:hypothetical protein